MYNDSESDSILVLYSFRDLQAQSSGLAVRPKKKKKKSTLAVQQVLLLLK